MRALSQVLKVGLRASLSAALLATLTLAAARADHAGIGADDVQASQAAPAAICSGQSYALCAEASSFVFNNIAYAQCQVKRGNSISAPPFNYPVVNPAGQPKQNICDLNAQGAGNGYMASTFSPPANALKGGTAAVYTCPGGSTGAYAQCEGGICFKSTQGHTFPGLPPLQANEIICSCPISQATASNDPLGYQIIGPFPCQKDYFKNCTRATNALNGTLIPVGAPTGTPRLLTKILTGTNPQFNQCLPN